MKPDSQPNISQDNADTPKQTDLSERELFRQAMLQQSKDNSKQDSATEEMTEEDLMYVKRMQH